MKIADETLAEIRAKHPDAIVLDLGEAEVVLRPFDAAAVDRWINDGSRSQEDADRNAVTRHLLWPTLAALEELRRAQPLLDGEIVEGLAVAAGKPPRGRVATFDDLNEDTPAGVLERAGVSPEQATALLGQVRAQGRQAVVVYAPSADGDEPFAAVMATPRPQDLAPLTAQSPEAKKRRAEAIRSMAAGCVLWTRDGAPADVLQRRAAVAPLVLAEHLFEMAGSGALRATKSRR